MSIILGLKGFKIEQQAKLIMSELTRVQTSFTSFYTDFALIGRHLKNAENKYEETAKKAEKFNDRIGRVTGVKKELLESSD
jgi:DNA anti-recombination protein RmuC